MRSAFLIGMCLSVSLIACSHQPDKSQEAKVPFATAPCEVGVYGQPAAFIAVTRRNDNFRYSFSDGRWGKIEDANNVECGQGAVRVDGATILERQTLKITDTEFDSDGVTLVGQLLEPLNAGADTPLVALAHGSEELGWIEAASYPYQLVGRGVSVFVYDKRGTGKSGGMYTQNFPQLADDLVAASVEAKRLAGSNYGRFGLLGFSQGGWIAPLASERSEADFIGIGYGLVVDILEEDASQVALELRQAGYDEDVVSKGKEITDITARLAVSGYSDGLEELDAIREKYGDEEWYPKVRGGFTGVILGISSDELRNKGIPIFDRLNIDWSIKPMDVLGGVEAPQLWVLAEDDREAPISTTLERLKTLRQGGKDISVFTFPNTDHGMWEYEQHEDGSRTSVRVTDKYYDLMADWAKGSLNPPYAESSQE